MLRTFKYFALLFIAAGSVHAKTTHGFEAANTSSTPQNDSTKTATPLRVDYISDPLNTSRFHSIDTSLNGWELTKPVYAEGLGRMILSDALTASGNLIFEKSDFTHPVLLADPFSIYRVNPQSLKFIHGTRRFTELNYIQGPQKDQQVQISYGQLVSKRLFAGFDYLRAASIGYFNRQVGGVSNLDLWLSYYTKNFRYRIFADAIWNKNSSQENGGLKYYTPDQQSQTLPVNLNLSENRTTTRYFNVVQQWSPSLLSPSSLDTSVQSHFNTYSHFLPARLFLASTYKRNICIYSDQSLNDGFYENFYFHINSTGDSIVSDHFSNKFGIQGSIGGARDSAGHYNHFEASVNHDFFSMKQGDQSLIFPTVLNEFTDLSASASIRNDSPASAGFWQAATTYYFDGRNKNDYSVSGLLGYHLNKVLAADVHGSADLTKPSLLENQYFSNNFIWQNDFLKKEIKRGGATVSSVKYKFSVTADYLLLNNFIYFDNLALPAQINQQKLMSIQVTDRIRWRHWHLLTKAIYQKPNGPDVLRLPQWQTFNSLYYENYFFKSALFAQIGVDCRYISGYLGDAYMPATRTFYLQDTLRVGGYKTFDLFINMRIKAARIFVKFENVAAGLTEKGIKYYAPGYPVTDFTIRFGISMRFFD